MVDADMEDYGFEYSDEEPEEQDVDIENQYYNTKGNAEMRPHLNSWMWRLKLSWLLWFLICTQHLVMVTEHSGCNHLRSPLSGLNWVQD